MNHIGLLLEARTIITAIALIFSLLILADTRRIYWMPWAFVFIALRLALSLYLRGLMLFQLPVDPHFDGGLKTLFSILDLLTVIAMWLGYGTVFSDTWLRRVIRRYWPFK